MGDSIPNYSDLSMGTDEYYGLGDTAAGFSGSSTLQDVQLGSPLVLDTSLGPSDAAITDFVGVQPTTSDVPNQLPLPTASQQLAGASDPGFSPTGSNVQNPAASPTPNASPMGADSSAGLTALQKFGASLASMFGGPSVTHAGAVQQNSTAALGPLPPGGVSSTNTLILVIVVGALILLLARSE